MNPKVRKLSEEEKRKMMISGQQGVVEFFYR